MRTLAFVPARLAAAALAFCLVASPTLAQEGMEKIGKEEYVASCAACHGEDGRGGGPVATYLTVKPTDLTQIAKNNGGTFPVEEIFAVIDGRSEVAAHGMRTMPVWGRQYARRTGETASPYERERLVQARILELLYHLQAIQE